MNQPLTVPAGRDVRLADFDPDAHEDLDRADAEAETRQHCDKLDELAYRLFAEAKRAVIVVLQGIDTSGKDGTIRMLASGVSPQCLDVKSFKAPSALELSHDFLWRVHTAVPAHGRIGIFNRSHYEDVLVCKVRKLSPSAEIEKRYEQINAFEKMLVENGTVILKFMLHISKDEQGKRLQERLDQPEKRWKFQAADLDDRKNWKDFMAVYETMLEKCSTEWAPWHIIPADHKWARNAAIAGIVRESLAKMDPNYPKPSWKPGDFVID